MGKSLPAIYNKHTQPYNQRTWLFGDWDNALRKAGFEPEKMRIDAVWGSDRVIRE